MSLISYSLWLRTTTPNFGNCFTFNSAFNEEEEKAATRNSSLTGATNGTVFGKSTIS